MITLLSALMVSSAVPQPAQAAIIGCHPNPGKVAACVTPIGTVKRAPVVEADSAPVERRACHPDPSKNKGCTRAVRRGEN